MSNLSVCRLCLREEELNQLKQDDENILQMIQLLISLHIWDDSETLTLFLCVHCETLLNQFQLYREECINNDKIFRQRLAEDAERRAKSDEYESSQQKLDEIEVDGTRLAVIFEDEEPQMVTRQRRTVQKSAKPPEVPRGKEAQPHEKRTKTKEGQHQAQRLVPCKQCGKMIVRSNMHKHLATHNPDRPQKSCSHCGKMFRDSQLLNVHINSHHTFERKYVCDECGAVYLRPNSLREHKLAKHSSEARYECKECGMRFSNFSKKSHHYIAMHTDVKPFACQYCDKAFKFKCDLTIHTRVHTGEKPFKCDICGKSFSKSYNVVIHKKSHRNVD
ncbi:zinc finger protein 506 [Anopheles darlingi]|uniref:Zinc finger protein 506 n=1 Tax=Anopheles darlingi TaxID=43151 RepID=W5JSA9_ANODA|nr:zinc finger protein 506 [Anopheles darlingi]